MKTTTIFLATEKADSLCVDLGIWLDEGVKSKLVTKEIYDRKARQWGKFRAALLRRIEQGDRAREALKVFADDMNWNFNNGIYEWDQGILVGGPCGTPDWETTNPIIISQVALEWGGKP